MPKTVTDNPFMSEDGTEEVPVHKRRILLRPKHFEQLALLAERDEVEMAELVNRAVREFLERSGFWPPKPEPKDAIS